MVDGGCKSNRVKRIFGGTTEHGEYSGTTLPEFGLVTFSANENHVILVNEIILWF